MTTCHDCKQTKPGKYYLYQDHEYCEDCLVKRFNEIYKVYLQDFLHTECKEIKRGKNK